VTPTSLQVRDHYREVKSATVDNSAGKNITAMGHLKTMGQKDL
jgi:hypothetical protein